MTSDSQYAHKRAESKEHRPLIERLRDPSVWVSQDGRRTAPADMDPVHRRNTIAWLERRAQSLHFQYTWSLISGPQPSGEMACDDFESMLDELEAQDPLEWLNEQPLMQALRRAEEEASKPVGAMAGRVHPPEERARRSASAKAAWERRKKERS